MIGLEIDETELLPRLAGHRMTARWRKGSLMSTEEPEVFEPRLAGIAVLVVDDHDDSRDFVAIMLELHGARVAKAASLDEAVEAFTASRPAVVVTDIQMPDGDGFALLARLAEIDGAVPIVAATAHDDPAVRARALEAGFAAFVTKPLDASEFIAVIASVTVPGTP